MRCGVRIWEFHILSKSTEIWAKKFRHFFIVSIEVVVLLVETGGLAAENGGVDHF